MTTVFTSTTLVIKQIQQRIITFTSAFMNLNDLHWYKTGSSYFLNDLFLEKCWSNIQNSFQSIWQHASIYQVLLYKKIRKRKDVFPKHRNRNERRHCLGNFNSLWALVFSCRGIVMVHSCPLKHLFLDIQYQT